MTEYISTQGAGLGCSYIKFRTMRHCFYLLLCTCVLGNCTTNPQAANDTSASSSVDTTSSDQAVEVHPIFHAATVLTQGDRTIYIDPYGGAQRFANFAAPDLVLITHTHPDHLDTSTLSGLDLDRATLIAPRAVVEAMTANPFAETQVLANGENYDWRGVTVTAVPAYNDPPKENFHPEGKFNGYVLDFAGERYYFSGDTEGVEGMRDLENIDVAFVCMNLPYTMDVTAAADAVAAFSPAVVYPYHYRNQDETFSDLEQFRTLVNEQSPEVEVIIEDWYPQ